MSEPTNVSRHIEHCGHASNTDCSCGGVDEGLQFCSDSGAVGTACCPAELITARGRVSVLVGSGGEVLCGDDVSCSTCGNTGRGDGLLQCPDSDGGDEEGDLESTIGSGGNASVELGTKGATRSCTGVARTGSDNDTVPVRGVMGGDCMGSLGVNERDDEDAAALEDISFCMLRPWDCDTHNFVAVRMDAARGEALEVFETNKSGRCRGAEMGTATRATGGDEKREGDRKLEGVGGHEDEVRIGSEVDRNGDHDGDRYRTDGE